MINVASTASIRPRPRLVMYNATKGALEVMSKGLAAEYGPHNIRVNCISPVMGVTGLLETFMGLEDTPKNRAKFTEGIPMGRLSEPEDIAKAALFLASDQSSFITGHSLVVDGGRVI